MAQFSAHVVVVSVVCLCICGICDLLYGFSPLPLVLLSSYGNMLVKLTAVATVMVDIVPIVSWGRHCTLHHVPSVRWEPY